MSRIGKIPVPVPQGVQVTIEPGRVRAKGPHGELQAVLPVGVTAKLESGSVLLSVPEEDARALSAIYGTTRAHVANVVQGVHQGFSKVLDIVGLGFKAQAVGQKLTLNLGYSHPVEFAVPQGVKVGVDPKSTQLTVSGADKDMVGAVAAGIRALRPPEPYKGTGIRYQGEHIIRKAGKTAAGVGAGAGAGGKK